MKYVLMHKDIEVLDFEWDSNANDLVLLDVLNYKHIPIGLLVGNRVSTTAFYEWMKGRCVPASRDNIEYILNTFRIRNKLSLGFTAFGLSLTDCYWYKPVNEDLYWEDINFYANDFSDDLGPVFLGEEVEVDVTRLSLLHPNNTSDGWLKKKWKIVDDNRTLFKGGSGPYYQQPYNELVSTWICEVLDVSHASYSIVDEGRNVKCLCKSFCVEDLELVPAHYCVGNQEYENFLEVCKSYNLDMDVVKIFLDKMIVLDFLMLNTDRHFGNFGFLRDFASLEIVSLAPIFDTGTSLAHEAEKDDLKMDFFGDSGISDNSKCFKLTNEEQLELVSNFKFLKLDELKSLVKRIQGIDCERAHFMSVVYNRQLKKLEMFISKGVMK